MAKLTNVQRRTLKRALLDLERAQRFLLLQLLTDEQPASEAQDRVAAQSPLPRHVEMLMLEAARTAGTLNADDILPCIEERLTLEECETVRAFLDWLTRHGLTFGHGNIQARYAAFQAVAHPAWLLSNHDPRPSTL